MGGMGSHQPRFDKCLSCLHSCLQTRSQRQQVGKATLAPLQLHQALSTVLNSYQIKLFTVDVYFLCRKLPCFEHW